VINLILRWLTTQPIRKGAGFAVEDE
jgi:hypothetical protein